MIPITLTGVWAATQQSAPDYRWVPITPLMPQRDFLVIRKQPDGTLTAFIRNPEANSGAHIGTRVLDVNGTGLRWKQPGRPDMFGLVNPDGTLTIDELRFHRATAADLSYYYPSPSTVWHYDVPEALNDGWPVATLPDVDMQVAPIGILIDGILAERDPVLNSPYIQSIAIARHGKLVLDQYFYGLGPNNLHDVRSAGKSVTTLMVGRAIEDTEAFSSSSPVVSLLSYYRPVKNDSARKERITVADLMTMASGLACDDNDDASPGNEDTMQSQPPGTDWYRYTLDLPMASDPGTRSVYCTAGINLLGAIIEGAVRMPLEQYFSERFAKPMEFGGYAMWLMPPPANAAYMGGGDRFRPRDFLKFGELLLDHGAWEGRHIVNSNWIEASILPRTAPEGEGDRYGYGWHITSLSVGSQIYPVISAGGNGGQLLIVVPKLDIAIMVTAGNYNQYRVWRNFLPNITSAVIQSCT
jgi:CubicO group peptidase (beta-lactamase class C family)